MRGMTNQHKRALLLRVDVNVQKNVTKKQPPSFVVNFFDDFDFAVDGRSVVRTTCTATVPTTRRKKKKHGEKE